MGSSRVLYVDPSISGVSGNMLLGALVDLGAPFAVLEQLALKATMEFGCSVEVKRERVRRYGFGALWLDWAIHEVAEDIPGVVFLDRVKRLGSLQALGPQGQAFATDAGLTLVQAEAAVHDQGLEEVIFHELGSYDTVLDVVGTASLLEERGLLGDDVIVYSAPVTVGKGNLEVRHGHLSVPPFVTAELLRRHGIPHRFSHLEGEFATPTGVALLAALVDHWSQDLGILPRAMGHGAGAKDLQGVPNVLRLVMGETQGEEGDTISVIETTVDDATGEIIGYTLEKLLAQGAVDVQVWPTVGKKNRPGHIIQVLAKPGDEARLSEVLMGETGSLGVRIESRRKRRILAREEMEVQFPIRGDRVTARVKISRDPVGRVVRVKAEYEDARAVAERTGEPVRIVLREAERAAEEALAAGSKGIGRKGNRDR